MKITPQLADQLAELSRLHDASRQDPHDLEIKIHSCGVVRFDPLLSEERTLPSSVGQ